MNRGSKVKENNSIFSSLREGVLVGSGGNGIVWYGIRPDPVTGLYDLNDAPAQLPDNDPNPQGRDRYVRTDDARRMVQGHEIEIVRALGIQWNGRDHIRRP